MVVGPCFATRPRKIRGKYFFAKNCHSKMKEYWATSIYVWYIIGTLMVISMCICHLTGVHHCDRAIDCYVLYKKKCFPLNHNYMRNRFHKRQRASPTYLLFLKNCHTTWLLDLSQSIPHDSWRCSPFWGPTPALANLSDVRQLQEVQ